METVESIVPPRSAEDSDQEEWEKICDDVAVARAALVHNMEAHDDAVANLTLSSFESVETDDTTLDERLREMNAAMARLLNKGDEKVEIKEEAAPPGDLVPEEGPSETTEAVAMDTDKAEAPAATGDFVPEAAGDDPMDGGYPSSSSRPFAAFLSGSLEEKVFHIDGFPENFPGIGKKAADLAKQLTKEEIAALFTKVQSQIWTRTAVERVLEVYQTYKRQVAQEKMLAVPFSKSRAGVGHGRLGQLDPGSSTASLMCPNCFSDWLCSDNKVEGKCKLCQKTVIAVDKRPASTEIKLGLPGVSWHRTLAPGPSRPPHHRISRS